MTLQTLTIRAGSRALRLIREEGLDPDRVAVLAGAAGGPKWLVLYQMDRMVLARWIRRRSRPLSTVGASIGSWRFAALARSSPEEGVEAFKEAYISQAYSERPSPAEITAGSRGVMDAFLPDSAVNEVLHHPWLRPGILAVRCRGLTASEHPLRQGIGFAGAMAANLASRRLLRFFFERTLFFDPRGTPPLYASRVFPAHCIPAGGRNLKNALLASGSIPMVMQGGRGLAGALEGTYRDGGVLDYHLDLPWNPPGEGLVLMPHYTERIIPGWLDKKLAWRQPAEEHFRNVVVVSPSRDFVSRLPGGRIPDRDDFYRFRGDDRGRMRAWRKVARESRKMAEEFAELVESGNIRNRVRPLCGR